MLDNCLDILYLVCLCLETGNGKQTNDPPRQKALTRQKTLLDKRPSDKTPSDKRPSYELFFWNGGGSFVRADGQKALLMY